jgi:hypothetical protein
MRRGSTIPSSFASRSLDYLRLAGDDGWELVAAVTHEQKDANYDVLYLKREI